MADLSVTAASVQPGPSSSQASGIAGEAITAGQPVYVAADGKYYKAKNSGTAIQAQVVGIALNGAAAGQPLVVQTAGDITIGATVTVGSIYVASANAGGIAPATDLISTERLTIIGWGDTAASIFLKPAVTGVVMP